jgi:predicted transcriptional regulator
MAKTLRCLKDHRDFILSHDLSGIPRGFQVMLGVVCDGREIIENDPAIPSEIHQKVILPLLLQARNFLVASSTLVPEHQLTVAQAVREGGRLQSVTTPRIIQELRLRSYILRDESLRSRTELFSRSEINLHLMVTETHLFLTLPRLDKTYDLENIIISKDPQAVQWGRMLFLYFQSSAEKVDLNTF